MTRVGDVRGPQRLHRALGFNLATALDSSRKMKPSDFRVFQHNQPIVTFPKTGYRADLWKQQLTSSKFTCE